MMRGKGGGLSAKHGSRSASSTHCVIASTSLSASRSTGTTRTCAGGTQCPAGGRSSVAWLPVSASGPPLPCGLCSVQRGRRESHGDRPANATGLRAAHCAWPAAVRAQLGCPTRLEPTATIWAVLYATRSASQNATAPLQPRCGGSRTAPGDPGRRRTARSSAVCIMRVTLTAQHLSEYGGLRKAPGHGGSCAARLAPACRDAGHARRNVEGESLCDRPVPAPMWRAALSALLTAERAQLDCPRLPSAYSLFAGRATRYADSESPAPATTRTWPAALFALPAADQLDCLRARHCRVDSAVLR